MLAVPEEMLELLVDALVVVFALMLVDVALVVVDHKVGFAVVVAALSMW